MTKPLITLPCTARELENSLHAVCDHDGLWDAKVCTEDVFVPLSDAPSYAGALTHKRVTRLVIETETKEHQRLCGCCANKECGAKGTSRVVVCNNFK